MRKYLLTIPISFVFAVAGLPLPRSVAEPPAKSTAAPKLDLNTATAKELEELPGVGPATAKKIMAGRPYKSIGDLKAAGLSDATITKITPLVTVGSSPKSTKQPAEKSPPKAVDEGPARIDLNTATNAELEKLPGVNPATAKKIIAGRPYKAVSDLKSAGLTDAAIAKIAPLAEADKFNLNSATASQLALLPGVGEATAKKIIAGRPYASISDLSRAGVPAATISRITPYVTVEAKRAAISAKSPPHPGMVWCNTETKIYHKEGDRWYGKTQHGEWMTEADAIKAGYRASK